MGQDPLAFQPDYKRQEHKIQWEEGFINRWRTGVLLSGKRKTLR